MTVGAVLEYTGLPYFGLNGQYVAALNAAGADVILLPAGQPAAAAILDRLDGVLFPGGLDVDPSHYGEEPTPALGRVNSDLDELELPLVRQAVELGLPILGVCRGHQMVNVALGGTLYQDITAEGVSSFDHWAPLEKGRDYLAHTIRLEPDSYLREIVGRDEIEVNSFHHQAVKRVAPRLRPNAVSPDGVVEGLESVDGLVLTMQCHPESLAPSTDWARALFEAFVSAAAVRSRQGTEIVGGTQVPPTGPPSSREWGWASEKTTHTAGVNPAFHGDA
ncbi:MAG: gamma-glutamyl-gamma-aminobutyrate hydrolase family protein [Candidatus Dormibacteraeota bacterium]|jgi:putative glutamine amidotransferase|nr:gamma-glutamyl-gamma-aminobutyrate hydrolase family protein [Candidatus Dormibacteraeota bacterium]